MDVSIARACNAAARDEIDVGAVIASGQLFSACEPAVALEKAGNKHKTIFGKILFALHESRRREGARLIRQYRHLIADPISAVPPSLDAA